MGAEHFAPAAAWRRLLDDYYRSLVGDDPTVEPKRPTRSGDDDVEVEPINPSSFTGDNPTAGAPGQSISVNELRANPVTTAGLSTSGSRDLGSGDQHDDLMQTPLLARAARWAASDNQPRDHYGEPEALQMTTLVEGNDEEEE